MEALEGINPEMSSQPRSVRHSGTRGPRFQVNTPHGGRQTRVLPRRAGRTLTPCPAAETEFALKREAGGAQSPGPRWVRGKVRETIKRSLKWRRLRSSWRGRDGSRRAAWGLQAGEHRPSLRGQNAGAGRNPATLLHRNVPGKCVLLRWPRSATPETFPTHPPIERPLAPCSFLPPSFPTLFPQRTPILGSQWPRASS